MARESDPLVIRQMRSVAIEIAVCPFKRAALEFELQEFWKALAVIVTRRESQLRELYGVPTTNTGEPAPCGCRERERA